MSSVTFLSANFLFLKSSLEFEIESSTLDHKEITSSFILFNLFMLPKVIKLFFNAGSSFIFISNLGSVKACDISEKMIGKYYEVHISSEHPEYSRIQLDREVTDTVRIRAAGFEIE